MKNKIRNLTRCIVLLLVTVTAIIFLSGCVTRRHVATEGSEILEFASADLEAGNKNYDYVLYYLRDWGFPDFDIQKIMWSEAIFQNYYVYNGGLDTVLNHAAATAEYYVENYFDSIDRSDYKAVTDAVIDSYVRATGDPYSFYRTPEAADEFTADMSGKFGGIGVVVEYDHNAGTISISSVNIGSPAEAAGFAVGDMIIAVDGKSVEELGYLNAVYYVRGEIGTDVSITVLRDGKELTLTATRAEVVEKVVAYEITEDGYGYIAIAEFKSITYEQFVEAYDAVMAAEVKGIIFDLRNNPGGYVDSVCNTVSYILPTGNLIASCHYKMGDPNTLFTKDDVHPTTGETFDSALTVPVVVLCNEYTASAGEIFTAVLRDYNKTGLVTASVVGTTTYGKGIMQSSLYYSMSDMSTLTLTIAYYNPPSGKNYQDIGITPDITVENTETEDLQYEAAIRELERLITTNK